MTISQRNTTKLIEINVNDATFIFNYQPSDLLDHHAPLQTKRFVVRPNTQWYGQLGAIHKVRTQNFTNF